MNNLFSIFDPNVSWLNINLNWITIVVVLLWFPNIYWLIKPKPLIIINLLIKSLAAEYKLNFAPINTPGHTHWAISLFVIILLNNLAGLTPYTFTATRHLSFTARIALVMWLSYTVFRIIINIGRFLAHLIPVGTPYILIPFMVVIELVRNLIRPITLSVRLAANLVAGHLLITLVRVRIVNAELLNITILLTCLYTLIILEAAVAFIQAYVFRILRTLYLREVNYVKFNYLYN